MNELIKIETNENLEPIVSGRELHEKLGVETPYTKWIGRMVEYGFTENVDFVLVRQKCPTNNPKNPETEIIDHIIKLDMAKEIAMLQRNEAGKKIRKYFIEVEKEFNSPEKIMAKGLKYAEIELTKVKAKIEVLETKIFEDAPRVAYAENMEKSSDCILVREFAKVLANEGINLGEKRVYKFLRERGHILKGTTEPSQKAVEQGLFKVSHGTIKTIKGDLNTKTTKITGKGQIYFLDLIRKEFKYEIMN